jgi:hypothetical protein
MLKLPKNLRDFVALLNAHDVRYLVVGGYAVAYHGSPRMTGDIDFFVEASQENARKLETVLSEFGFAGLGLTPADFLEPDTIIQLGYPPNRIDLITSLSGVTFAPAWEQRVSAEVDGVTLVFVGKETLLANKAASGRPKDLADLDALS